MPVEIFTDDDADLSVITGRTVAIIGFGERGEAHALCLRDAGVDVRVGVPEGSADRDRAAEEGLRVISAADAAAESDLVALLVPHAVQQRIYAESVATNLQDGDALFFGDGFDIRFGRIEPPAGVDVAMVAATAPGRVVRRQFVDGKGVPTLVAVGQDASGGALQLALSYAKAIGGTRAGAMLTTFGEQTEAVLFGQQAVACGGAIELVLAGFDVLTAGGYPPEIAYLACVHELKAVADRLYEGGLAGLDSSLPDIARYGAAVSGPRVIDDAVRDSMRAVLVDIRTGEFAARFTAASDSGGSASPALTDRADAQRLEDAGRRLRTLMSWLAAPGQRGLVRNPRS